MKSFRSIVVCASLLAGGSAFALDAEQRRACSAIGSAAEEAAELRVTGLGKAEVEQRLAVGRSAYEVGMATTAAFTYIDLRGFAMSDFVESFCRLTVGKQGKLSDFDNMMIKHRYDRHVECSKQGRWKKSAFIACWNEQADAGRPAASTPR